MNATGQLWRIPLDVPTQIVRLTSMSCPHLMWKDGTHSQLLFARSKPPAGHTMVTCWPKRNQISPNWSKSGPDPVRQKSLNCGQQFKSSPGTHYKESFPWCHCQSLFKIRRHWALKASQSSQQLHFQHFDQCCPVECGVQLSGRWRQIKCIPLSWCHWCLVPGLLGIWSGMLQIHLLKCHAENWVAAFSSLQYYRIIATNKALLSTAI